MFMKDNNSDIREFFPLNIEIYYPIGILDFLNYDQPFSNSLGMNIIILNYNKVNILNYLQK